MGKWIMAHPQFFLPVRASKIGLVVSVFTVFGGSLLLAQLDLARGEELCDLQKSCMWALLV